MLTLKGSKQSATSSGHGRATKDRRKTDEPRVIHVKAGKFTSEVDVIPSTSQNLVVVLGKTDAEETVLVPHVEFRCRRETEAVEGGTQDALSATISFENASFLIFDVCEDFARVSEEIAKLCSERCSLERDSADYILQRLKGAATAVQRGISAFEEIRSHHIMPRQGSGTE